MKVATWNVNSLTARWPRVKEWIDHHQPDVLLLQETKQTDQKFPFVPLSEMGYESAHYGSGRWNGVAIVSRVGMEDVHMGLEGDSEARLIGATCHGLRVYSCYVPNGRALDHPHYAYKLRWLASLRQLLSHRDPHQPVVLGGDFNIALTDADVYDPSAFEGATHVSPAERTALRALLHTGLVDMNPHPSAQKTHFTWWDYRSGSFHRDWGMRIDYLFADSLTAQRFTRVCVDRDARKGEKPSDHAPVVGELTY